MDINELLIKAFVESLPVLLAMIAALIALKYAMNTFMMSKKYQDDKYRHELEKEIAILNRELTFNEERFKSVNHLLIKGNKFSFSENESESDVGAFLANLGINEPIKPIDKSVFVLTPLNPEYSEDYSWVEEAFNKHKYTCTKGDDVKVQNNLLGHIIKQMLESTFVVANISGRNPNVFYELGIAHALNKDVVLISRSENDITFDLSSSQVMIYNNKETLSSKLEKWLISTLESKIRS